MPRTLVFVSERVADRVYGEGRQRSLWGYKRRMRRPLAPPSLERCREGHDPADLAAALSRWAAEVRWVYGAGRLRLQPWPRNHVTTRFDQDPAGAFVIPGRCVRGVQAHPARSPRCWGEATRRDWRTRKPRLEVSGALPTLASQAAQGAGLLAVLLRASITRRLRLRREVCDEEARKGPRWSHHARLAVTTRATKGLWNAHCVPRALCERLCRSVEVRVS